jgi:hypothetical protein
MINPSRLRNHLQGLFVGFTVAGVVAYLISSFSRAAAFVVFVLLSALWITFAVAAAKQADRARGGRLGAFSDPKHWTPQRLPLEFRFITRDTAMREVFDKIGPGSTRPPDPPDALRYDWPDGRVVFVYPEFPATRSGRVRAIQLYDHKEDVPVPL